MSLTVADVGKLAVLCAKGGVDNDLLMRAAASPLLLLLVLLNLLLWLRYQRHQREQGVQ